MTTAFDSPAGDFDPSRNGQAYGGGAFGGGPADLSAFDDDYEEAEAPSAGDVPDGKYQVRVHRVDLSRSQAGDPMLKWDLLVLSGPHADRHIFKNSVITRKSLPFVKGDLLTLGVELPRFSELPDHLDSLLDKTLEVNQRTKGEYTNVYFNRRIELAADSGDLRDEPAPF